MKTRPAPSLAAFDHLVVMLRDELEARSPTFEAAGFQLSAPGHHNLGSVNRLIVLDSAYIELLGWPAGEAPRRKEIADLPLGLDALVFRSEDAAADQKRLHGAGFDPDPVSHLERPLDFHGQTRTARFKTVRFSRQPIAGLRIYFCQHLTPEYIWDEASMQHQNQAKALQRIYIEADNAADVAHMLARLVAGGATLQDGRHTVTLPNAELVVLPAPHAEAARIVGAELLHADGGVRAFETGIA